MPEPLPEQPGLVPIAPGVGAPDDSVRVQFSRSSGPGGQNVNKVNSRVELWVKVEALVGMTYRAKQRLRGLAGSRMTLADELHIAVEAGRSQHANRDEAFARLRELVILARVEPKVRKKTRPSKGSRERRLTAKRHRGQIKSHRRGSHDE